MIIENQVKLEVCTHCGENCDDTAIQSGDNQFCCLGCKTVFEILHDNGLEAYYTLEPMPGNTLRNATDNLLYGFLDEPSVQRKILDFQDGKIAKVRLYIPTIHCSSCIWLLENLYKLKSGVLVSQVDFPKKTIRIDYNPINISLREIVELLSSLGYIPEITLEKGADQHIKGSDKQRETLVKIGVAGFSFGNIMLFSFPEYIGMNRLIDSSFSEFFGYISLFFSLPVLVYSASDYFKASIKSLQQRIISIDVPIVLGILALFFRSSYEIIAGIGPGYLDSLSGLVFFLLIGKWFQGKTYESLLFDRNFKSYFPIAITKISEGIEASVSISELQPGDSIRIRNNELVPADCILLSKEALIDNSFVTGESVPISQLKGSYVFAGGRQMGSSIELKVEKAVSQSYLTQLWNNSAFKKQDDNRKLLVNSVSKYFTISVLILAVSSALFWYFTDSAKTLQVFTAVLIVACPCALALSTPFAIGNSMRILGKRGIYLKNGRVLEIMAQVKHLFFDKTGTITVQSNAREIRFEGKISEDEKRWFKILANHSMHPLSRMITQKLGDTDIEYAEISDFYEESGRGISGFVNGHKVKLGSRSFIGEGIVNGTAISTNVFASIDNEFKGVFRIQAYYRNGLKSLIENLSGKYDLSLVSGDNDSEKKYLSSIFKNEDLIFEQSAFDKLERLKHVQAQGSTVMMIGDGLNDSGALAQADVGVAVTDDINNFTPGSDVILSGQEFSNIGNMLRMARGTKAVIISSFGLSFLYNFVGLGYAISGLLTPIFAAILMPLSSITIVVFTTAATQLLAKKYKLD